MRVFILAFFVGLTCAAPQGYNYQIEVGPSGNSVQAIPNQYQFIQQQQQEQPQFVYQGDLPQLQELAQTVTLDQQGGYKFGNQLLQNAQQVIQYEQQHQDIVPQHQLLQEAPEVQHYEQQHKEVVPQSQLLQNAQQVIQYGHQHQEVVPQQQQHETKRPSPVVEPPPTKIVEIIEPPKPVEKPQNIIDSQPQFIIQTKKPTKTEAVYHAPAENKKIVFEKEFFYLSAPKDEEDETPKDLEDQLTTLKKNLRVVFIKAPENNGIEKAALQLAQQSINSQTAIYVLSKQHSASDLAQKLQSIKTSTPQRPEVAFIKYRTPEEAEHAQRVIQAQYEALDGPNHINMPNTGVTHNFIGDGDIEPRKPSVSAREKVEVTKPVSKYLPTAVKH